MGRGTESCGQWSGLEDLQPSSDFTSQPMFTSLDGGELNRDYGPGPPVAKMSCMWLLTCGN